MVQTLADLGISYALYGAVAVNLRGAPRLTTDIDLILDVPGLRQPLLLEALERQGARYGEIEAPDGARRPRTQRDALREWAEDGLTFLELGEVRVDLLRPVDPLHRAALQEATELAWPHGRLRVVTAEYLILDKLIAGRGKDLDDVRRLSATWRGRLDRTKVDPWLSAIEAAGGVAEADARALLDR